MIVFIKLLLAHLLGDFVFQSHKMVSGKESKKLASPYLYLHFVIHLLLLCLLFSFEKELLSYLFLLALVHLIIDVIKIYLQRPYNTTSAFLYDQMAHLLSISFITYLIAPFKFETGENLLNKILTASLFILLTTFVASFFIRKILARWQSEIEEEESLKGAGMWIGMLERMFVFAFIALSQFQAIGFLIAAKSVLRFNDLTRSKDRKLTEYILIGTLLSFGWAILCGIIFGVIWDQL